ncbi:MAG: hypothetical protein WC325_13640, partial [Candidatus Bathyarchaeia archaeon]
MDSAYRESDSNVSYSSYWFLTTVDGELYGFRPQTVNITVSTFDYDSQIVYSKSGAGTEKFYLTTLPTFVYLDGVFASEGFGWSKTGNVVTVSGALSTVTLSFISDVTSPTYTVIGHSGSTGGSSGSFYLYANDNIQLGTFFYSYKVGSGSYVNLSATTFSSTPSWANISQTLPAQNTTYYFKYYFSDSSGNWNVTSEQSFAVTYISSGPEPTPTPTATATPIPTATPTPSPMPTPSSPVRAGETRNLYFRSDTYTAQGVSAYGLDVDVTDEVVTSNVQFDVDMVKYGLRVYLVTSSTHRTELTTDYSAVITLTSNSSGYVYGYWGIPETDVILGYQALEFDVYSYTPSSLWILEKSFITPVLITKEILSSSLTFTLYVNTTFTTPSTLGGTSDVTSSFVFGDVTHKSGIYGLTVTTPRQSDIQLWRLNSGDYVGFEI